MYSRHQETSWPLIHRCIKEQTERSSDTVAVIFGDDSLSYGELDRMSNQLAHHLRKRGIGPNVMAGVCLERSLELVVAILGILKAGGAYVPLDPVYPQDRLAHMLSDSGSRVLLTQQRLLNNLPEHSADVLCMDSQWKDVGEESQEDLDDSVMEDHLIYVIYTSGSTGRPKGAAVYHRGFANLLGWYTSEFEYGNSDRVLLITSLSFDLTQKNIFAPLMTGGQLVLLKTPHYDAGTILDSLAKDRITTINCTPSAFYGLLGSPDEALYEKMKSLKYVFLGGEPISFQRLESWLNNPLCRTTVVNTYGPTECTDVCAFYRLHDYSRYLESGVPTGIPISNTELYILDSELKPVPRGKEGELCIGGAGVGAGYINRPELTAEKFVPNSFNGDPGSLLYRTGDWARFLPDGNVEFLGRIDHQVKVRGFRIELGEIEGVLEKHPAIHQAVVLAREDEPGEKRLVAYMVTKPGFFATISEIRTFLQSELPDYMLPTGWVFMDGFPLTPNAKVDRNALPPPDSRRPDLDQEFVPPRNDLEQYIGQFWCTLLNLEQVGVHDRFFELGGTSIKAIQFIGRLAHELRETIPIVKFFQAPTIAEFSQVLTEEYADSVSSRLGIQVRPGNSSGRESVAGGRAEVAAKGEAWKGVGNLQDTDGSPGAAELNARRRAANRREDLLQRRKRHRGARRPVQP